MSKFTGKCDFYDWCFMISKPEEVLKKAKIYYGDAIVFIKSEKDLFPYATHLIASMASSEEGQSIHLSRNSFIDDEERSSLSWRVRDCILLARKAKKEKVEFNIDYVMNKVTDFAPDRNVYLQIVNILNKNPDVVKFHFLKDDREMFRFLEDVIIPWYFSSVHLPMYNRERKEFVKYAKEHYNFATFGLDNQTLEEQKKGEYHPVIWSMCWKIKEFEEFEVSQGEKKCSEN